MRVRVYYNIRKKCLSVMDKSTRRVIDHVNSITLSDVKFISSKKGVARIRRNKRKAVVAFVEGDVAAWHASNNCGVCKAREWIGAVKFNPYRWETFVLEGTHRPITSASYVKIFNKEIMAYA